MDRISLITLEAIRQSGVTNMFDLSAVESLFSLFRDATFSQDAITEILFSGLPQDLVQDTDFQYQVSQRILFILARTPYLPEWQEQRDSLILEYDLRPSQVALLDYVFGE